MARWLRRTVLMFAVLLLTAIGVAPAQAGGPTSVLLSAPGIPKVVATGYYDKAYEELMLLVDTSSVPKVPGMQDKMSGPFVRATWLVHDMTVWRRDMIFPEASGGLWIATQLIDDGGKTPNEPVWHRATNGAALIKLLNSLGLGHQTGEQDAGGPSTFPSLPTSGPVADGGATGSVSAGDALQQPSQVIKADQGALSGWRWSIPGLLLGAAIAVVALRLLPRRRPWELIDEQ
jgi:hypothetical protein